MLPPRGGPRPLSMPSLALLVPLVHYVEQRTLPLGPTNPCKYILYCTHIHCSRQKTKNDVEFAFPPVCPALCVGGRFINPLQYHMLFRSSTNVNASSLLCKPRSMSAIICFKLNMFFFLIILDMTLNLWSRSSCVCPTIKNKSYTSRRCPNATNVTHNLNMYLFLFSHEQLSV